MLSTFSTAVADNTKISGPDGKLVVELTVDNGAPSYTVTYDGKTILEPSPLGLKSDVADFTKGLILTKVTTDTLSRSYYQDRIKRSHIDVKANTMTVEMLTADKAAIGMEWVVKNNDIAFRYLIPRQNSGETGAMVITEEATGFTFPEVTTTFITPQSKPMIGWKRSKPSYEEEYTNDDSLTKASKYGVGYTFPALFHVGDNGWALISETGVTGGYCGSRLSEINNRTLTVKYPMESENNGNGSAQPGIGLPGATPWRTITVGNTLHPIAETTIIWDVVDPLYLPVHKAIPSRGSWSWIVWQDDNSSYENQVAFINLAEAMGWEHVLIDAGWDKNIGRENVEKLIALARSKGVDVALWYSSSDYWNDITQSPTGLMNRPIPRKKEMKWMSDNGVHTIKVDFFGGDKQETMRIYEDILSDAADYGIDVIFHGCTLPRGWERLYPNYVGSEAVLASENIVFQQHFCDNEAFNATLHPFIRNTVGSMEFGGTFLQRRLGKQPGKGTIRRTGDAFQLATAILYQNPVQNFAFTPRTLNEAPIEAIDFMRTVPTTWDDIKFIEGYPGKYVVLARRHGNDWYIAGINAETKSQTITIDAKQFEAQGKTATLYIDTNPESLSTQTIILSKPLKVTIPSNCGFVLKIN
ncbi:MAG: glycoside hydrolase family 97 protein [Muribaculum sp.]|nr:glycoside hydrolase family 97 protein [Muribaculaceae bacterium]MCM1080410.1 glycoside hydrolase family 97 protein [Muribaculum sp.]